MYVCICNGISDSQVKEAINAGAKRWNDVHAFHGCEPCCGKCRFEIIREMVEAREDEAAPALAAPALVPAT